MVAAGMLQVGKRFMTIKEVMSMGRGHFDRLNSNLPVEQFREKAGVAVDKVIDLVVRTTLALNEAERELTPSQKEMIATNVQHIRGRFLTEAGGSEEQLRDKLKRNDLDLKEMLERERRKLTIGAYHRQKFMLSIVITRKMMWKYYQANRGRYVGGREVSLRVIVVPGGGLLPLNTRKATAAQQKEARAKAREMALEAAKAIEDGEDFQSVAKRVGKSIQDRFGKEWHNYDFKGMGAVQKMIDEGGLWPRMSPDNFPKGSEVLARAARTLEEGKVSEVEEADGCCYLIQAARVMETRNKSFEEAQEDILNILRNQEYRRRENKHLADGFARFNTIHAHKARKRFADLVLARVMHDYYEKQ